MTNDYTTSTPKIALVTGGSRGIGRNTVECLATRGVHSIFTYHSHSADAEAVVAAVRDAGAQGILPRRRLSSNALFTFDSVADSKAEMCRKGERACCETRRPLFCGAGVLTRSR